MAVNDYSDIYESAGKAHQVDPELLRSIVTVESGGNPDAVGPDTKWGNAEGITQLIPSTAKSLGVDNPYDPKEAINGTAKLLAENFKRYGSIEKAISAYHGGTDPANWGPKTQKYTQKVLNHYQPGGSSNMDNAIDDDPNIRAYEDSIKELQKTTKPIKSTSSVQLGISGDDDDPNIQAYHASNKSAEATKVSALQASKASEESLGARLGAGFQQGIRNVSTTLDPAAQWLEDKLGGPITFGGRLNSAAQEHALNIAARNKFQEQYGNDTAANIGAAGGEIAATLPVLGPVGKIVGAGGELAGSVLPRIGAAVENNKLLQLLGKGVVGAAQGASGSALVSGGSDAPLADQVKQGAELGGALGVAAPIVVGGAKYLGNVAKAAVAPFTESGQTNLANKIIQEHAGGIPNVNAAELVQGSKPTLAEASENAGVAGLQRTLRDMPGASVNPFVEREQANAAARSNLFQKAAGTPEDIQAAQAARKDFAKNELQNIFKSSQPTDSKEVLNSIDGILKGSGGERDAVVSSLNNIRSKLVDSEGNLKSKATDPEFLYNSVRKQIDDLLDKKDLTNQSGKQAARELMQVQESLDNAIENGAPGFKNYLSGYTEASKPINSMEWLQGLKLADAKGNITLSKVQNALQNVNKLQKAAGTNSAKSLTEDQVSTLRSIRDDLLRQTNTNLGRSAGSNTVQNLGSQNFLSALLPGKAGMFVGNHVNPAYLGSAVGAGAGQLIGHPLGGAAVGNFAGRAFSKAMQSKNAEIQNKLQQILLNPESFSAVNNDGVLSRFGGTVPGNLLRKYHLPVATVGSNRLINDRSDRRAK